MKMGQRLDGLAASPLACVRNAMRKLRVPPAPNQPIAETASVLAQQDAHAARQFLRPASRPLSQADCCIAVCCANRVFYCAKCRRTGLRSPVVDVRSPAPHIRMEYTWPADAKGLMLMRSTCLAHFQKPVTRADTLFPSMRAAARIPGLQTASAVDAGCVARCDGTTGSADARSGLPGIRTQPTPISVTVERADARGRGASDGTHARADARHRMKWNNVLTGSRLRRSRVCGTHCGNCLSHWPQTDGAPGHLLKPVSAPAQQDAHAAGSSFGRPGPASVTGRLLHS